MLSISEQRAKIKLTTPEDYERDYLWSQLTIPQAGLSPETGGYNPHRLIRRVHNGPWRYVALGGGLRGGKSLGASCEGIAWLPHSNLIWLAGETYDLTRQEFEYMAEGATSLDWVDGITMPKNKYQPCAFETPWGCQVETRSLHDLGAAGQGASLVARAPDLIIVCEPGFAPPITLQHSRERLTTRRGRLWMAGTFENANTWYVDTWHQWLRWPNEHMGKSFAIPSWLNLASFPGGKNDPELLSIKKSYATPQEFLVRWGGLPLASNALMMGNYWDDKKHLDTNADFKMRDHQGAKLPVYLTIDPGYSGNSRYVVLALQMFGLELVVIDEIAVQTMMHEEVINLCRTKDWWGNVVGGTMDPYAGVNHIYGGVSPIDIWWRHARVALQPSPRFEVEDITARLQHVMRDPVTSRSHLHVTPGAERLRYEMKHWRRKDTREGLGGPSDINCDAIKALAYFVSSRYTEDALGVVQPGGEPISVREFTVGGRPRGISIANRYSETSRLNREQLSRYDD